jgi:hypothetical protein
MLSICNRQIRSTQEERSLGKVIASQIRLGLRLGTVRQISAVLRGNQAHAASDQVSRRPCLDIPLYTCYGDALAQIEYTVNITG